MADFNSIIATQLHKDDVGRDVLNLANKQIRESEERYKRITETLTDYIYTVYFEDGIFEKTVHGQGCQMLTGYSVEEFEKEPLLWIDMVHEDDRNRVAAFFERILEKPIVNSIEHRIVRKDKLERWVRNTPVFHFNPAGQLISYDGIVQDITEIKNVQLALASSEERYRSLFNSITDVVTIIEMQPDGSPGKFIDVNPVMCETLGYTREELLCMSTMDITDNISLAEYELTNQTRLAAKKAVIARSLLAKNGDSLPFEMTTYLVELDKKPCIFSMGRNVLEKKKAQMALLESERRFKDMFQNSSDGIVLSDLDGRIIDCNPSFVAMMRYKSLQELCGKTFSELTPKEYHEFEQATVIPQMKAKGTFDSYDKEFIGKNGERIFVSLSGWVNYDANKKPFELWAIVRDISEKKKMDAEIQKTQHLESLSLLAGGIAHDFNNLLGGIFGYIDIAREYAPTPQKANEYLDKALKSLDRAKDLSQRLLTFSKGGAPNKTLASVQELLIDVTKLALSGSTIKPHFQIPKSLWNCQIDTSQIGRVINNLVLNAVQAMPDGGDLFIMAKNVPDMPMVSAANEKANFVKITIKDSGAGIPVQLLDKIFNPFFTTKKRGTGLGLSICQSIISKHSGMLDVESTVGIGTQFHVFLPASMQKIAGKAKKNEGTVCGQGRILIMDDEDFVLDLTSEMLKKLGYTVVTSQHGEEAIKLFEKSLEGKYHFDAVILDLTVPGGVGGVKALERIKTLTPTIKAIAASGYSNDPVMANPKGFGFTDALKKPFVSKELGLILHNVLEAK